MRKIIHVILLMWGMCSVSASAVSGQWKKVHTFYDLNGEPELITRIYFLDLPGPPRIGFVGTVSELWKTTDGGNTWSIVWPQPSSTLSYIADICFKDSATGWFAAEEEPEDIVYKTVDGGETWFPLPSSGSSDLFFGGAINFNEHTNRLYVSRIDTDLLASSDLGNSWNSLKTGGTGGFSFFSDTTGIVTSYTDTSSSFLRTTDGGLTWSKSNFVDTSRHSFSIIQPLAIPGTSTCFAATGGEIMILRSDDYGQNWRVLHDFGPPEDSQFHIIGPGGTGVISGNLSRLYIQTDFGMYVSTDEGLTWVFDGGPMAKSISETVRFYSANGVTFAALDTVAYPVFDGSLWEEVWPNSSITQPTPAEPANLSIYPNPTTGLVTISGSTGPVTVTNVLGESVLTANPDHPLSPSFERRGDSSSGLSLDLSRLPAGTYFVRIGTPTGEVVRRIVKE